MKTVTKIGFLAVAVLGIALVAPAAHATCGSDVTFGNFPTSGSCPGGGSCYVISPGANTILTLNGSIFWVIGKGNPVVNEVTGGVDNGSYQADGTGGTKPWLVGPYAGGFQMNSGWAQGVTDGCADVLTDTMAGAFFDTSADNLKAYFALSAANLDFSRGSQWDFGTGGAHIQLVAIPKPAVTASSRQPLNSACTGAGVPAACCTGVGTGTCNPANINVTVNWDVSAVPTAFTQNSGTATLGTVLTGYEVFTIETPGTTAPAVRTSSAWTSRALAPGATLAPAATSASFTFQCTVPSNNAFVALGLTLNSGFKSPVVGEANATRIACAGNLATPTKSKIKPIERKIQSNN